MTARSMLRHMIRNAFNFDPGNPHVGRDTAHLPCQQISSGQRLSSAAAVGWHAAGRHMDAHLPWRTEHSVHPRRVAAGDGRLGAAHLSARRQVRPHDDSAESPEGQGKSQGLQVLYSREFFSDSSILGVTDKEFQEAVRGRWCIEAADLSGMKRAEVERVKAQITREADRARPAYGRATIDAPRSCILYGTTNDEEYLQSQTGNRRFLPSKVGRVKVDELARDRDQLWAEAMDIECMGDPISLPESLWSVAGAEQSARTLWHPWVDALANASAVAAEYAIMPVNVSAATVAQLGKVYELTPDAVAERITSAFVAQIVLGIPVERQSSATGQNIGRAMRKNGWTGPKPLWIGGRTAKGFERAVLPDPCA